MYDILGMTMALCYVGQFLDIRTYMLMYLVFRKERCLQIFYLHLFIYLSIYLYTYIFLNILFGWLQFAFFIWRSYVIPWIPGVTALMCTAEKDKQGFYFHHVHINIWSPLTALICWMSCNTSLAFNLDSLPNTGDLVRGLNLPRSSRRPSSLREAGRADASPKVCHFTTAPPCDVLSHSAVVPGSVASSKISDILWFVSFIELLIYWTPN